MKVVCTTSSFDAAIPDSFDVVKNPHGRRLTEEEVTALLVEETPDGLIAGVEPLTRAVLEAAVKAGDGRLRVISRCGVGLDNVDLDAAADLGIEVRNTPTAPVPSVAELTVGLMLAALRSIPAADAAIRRGDWLRLKGGLLGSRTVGLVGCGRIGTAVATLVAPFGATLIGFDPEVRSHSLCRMVSFEDLLAQSDIVSLHAPLVPGTRHLIDADALRRMRPNAVLVNTARGALVDERALADALAEGQIAGAAVDVYEEEPYTGPLVNMRERTVLTSHIASSAREARAVMEAEAVKNLVDVLRPPA
jgi:D-3-phosphoglycerate dehydrogenase